MVGQQAQQLDQEQLLHEQHQAQQTQDGQLSGHLCCFLFAVPFFLPPFFILLGSWYPVLRLSRMEYVAKSCVVMDHYVDEYAKCVSDEYGKTIHCDTIFKPKVSVQVNGDLRINTDLGTTWAYRYHPDNSGTDVCSYGPEQSGTAAWAQQFDTGATVPCWQSTDDPEIVKLSEEAALHEQFWIVGPFMWLGTAVMVLYSGLICFVIYLTESKPPPEGTRTRGLVSEEEDEDADEEDESE